MTKKLILFLTVTIFISTSLFARGGYVGGMGGGCCGGWFSHGFMGWGFGIFGFLFFLFLVYLFIKYLIIETKKREPNAYEELKKRYARGEITKEEYEEIRKELLNT